MKSSIRDRVEGTFHELKDKVKEVAGKVGDNPGLKAEGIDEKMAGAFGRIQMMEKPINILHIDPDWKVIYFHIQNGLKIKSIVPWEHAILMLKNKNFDLILSEPQNIAILTPQTQTKELDYLSNCQLN